MDHGAFGKQTVRNQAQLNWRPFRVATEHLTLLFSITKSFLRAGNQVMDMNFGKRMVQPQAL
jgi:hypothetical protein